MNPREEFLTEEYVRYAAECRRMARLAKRPTGDMGQNPYRGAHRRSNFWEQIFELIGRPLGAAVKLAALRRV